MKYSMILLAWTLCPLSSPGLAQALAWRAHIPASPAARTDSEPRARIRGIGSAQGLSRESFARWSKDNAAFAGIARNDGNRPEALSRHFTAADKNGDQWVSAAELADWIAMRSPVSAEARLSAPGERRCD